MAQSTLDDDAHMARPSWMMMPNGTSTLDDDATWHCHLKWIVPRQPSQWAVDFLLTEGQ